MAVLGDIRDAAAAIASGKSSRRIPCRPLQLKLWHIWLALCLVLTALAWQQLAHFTAQDPDDYMRLLQVRDWLNGQAWFDSRQYRMNPPIGADMHWVRLVDLPIAAALELFRNFLTQRLAETAALTVVPLLQLLVGMVLLRRLLCELAASPGLALMAAALMPLFPLLTTNFIPMRIDHHGWQAIAALAVAWLMVRGDSRSAFIAGLVTAVWLMISVEGLPLAAAFGGLFALRYCWRAQRGHEAFLCGLALGGPVVFLSMRPFADFTTAYCDMLSWPHFLAFAGGAAMAASSRLMPAQDRGAARLLSLAPIVLVAAPAILLPLGRCAVAPMSTLDPVLRNVWFENIAESAPLADQTASVIAMLLWAFVIVGAGAGIAIRRAADNHLREGWVMLTGAALAAAGVSLLVMRAGLTAQLLALPFAAVLIWHFMPRARAVKSVLPRIAATVACIGFATPMLPSAALKHFDRDDAYNIVAPVAQSSSLPCAYDRLGLLPKAMLFASLDRGPEILARTQHSVVMSGYHRNQAKMLQVLRGFGEPLDKARAIILANHANYVVACTSSADLSVTAKMGSDNLSRRLFENRPPAWLEPVSAFAEGPLRVWRVLPHAATKRNASPFMQ